MPKAAAPAQPRGRCWTPGPEDVPRAPKAWDMAIKAPGRLSEESSEAPSTTVKTWWQLSEENSAVATPRGHKDGHEDGAAGHSWSRIRTSSPDTTCTAWWHLSKESSNVATRHGPECAPEAAKPQDTARKSWWQLSEENPTAATPSGYEDAAAGHCWSRIRTPSPEGRYALHNMLGAGTSQFSSLTPLPEQQRHTPYPEAPLVPAIAVPPAPQVLLLADVLRGERAESSEAPSDGACQRQLRQEERLGPGGPAAGGPRQAPADAHAVISIGSAGHPHSCGRPCKYSRGGRVCKDGAACGRCHLCPWRRSEKHDRAVVEHASAQR